MHRLHTLGLTLSLIGLTGCASASLDLRHDLDLHRSSFLERLAGDHRLTQEFLACAAQVGSPPSNGMRLSRAVPLGKVRSLIDRIRERRPPQADSLLGILDLVSGLADAPNRRVDLSTLEGVVHAIRRWHAHLDFDEDDLARDSSRFARLLLAYNKAYFGDVPFAREPAGTAARPRGVTKVMPHGFVDRGGNAWIFPGLTGDSSLADQTVRPFAAPVNSQQLSADLTRVFLEAFFDAAFQVPAVHGATALRVEWPSPDESYPEFDADRPGIPFDALARLTRDALRAETAATTAVGKAVRGGSVFGTHNETLAAALETAAGVVAKKLVEHEGFCYFRVMQGRPAAHESPGSVVRPVALSVTDR